jgi:hypothetical protein
MLDAVLALLLFVGPGDDGDAPIEQGTPPDWALDVETWDAAESEPETTIETAAGRAETEDSHEPVSSSLAASEDRRESITGSLRIVGGYLRFPDQPALFPERDDGFLATEARVIARRELSRQVDTELNVFLDLTRSPGAVLAGTFATAGSFATPYRGRAMAFSTGGDGPTRLQMGLDRARVGVRGNRVSFDLGRFPVNHSVAQIFTPNDFFAPFAATAVNTIFKPGVDAARLGVGLGKRSSLEVVSVMGWDDGWTPSWGNSALLVRPSIVAWNFEWAAVGGKVAQRWIAGASFQGDAGPIGLRGEGHVGLPDRQGNGLDRDEDVHVRLSAGPNVNFAWQGATLGAEYAFFSDGAGDPAHYITRFGRRFPDDLPYLGRHYVAAMAGLETLPILRLNAIGLVNAEDGSGMAGLFAAWSISDEADLLLGGFVPWGRRTSASATAPTLRSEFGLQPTTLFLETRVFF